MDKRKFLQMMAASPLAASPFAFGQPADYPNKPIRIVVPFGPGSTSDATGRVLGLQMQQELGQPMVMDNMPGAEGRLGVMAVKNAPADGYTMLLATWSNMSVNPILFKNLPYDPFKDFIPVSGTIRTPLGIIVPGSSKIASIQELVADAKARPGKVNVGTFSAAYRLAIEWFSTEAGIKLANVPYKSSGQMNTDLIGGQIDAAIDGIPSVAAQVKSGRVRLLAVTGDARYPDFPNVPTMKEAGYPNYSIYGWTTLFVRSDTPEAQVSKIAETMRRVFVTQPVREFAQKTGSEVMASSPAATRKFQLDQFSVLKRVADEAGIKAE